MPIEAAEINGLKCPEDKKQLKKYDGKGLYLLIKTNGSKLWRFRYVYAGKNKEMALGQYPSIKLANARKSAEDARILLSESPLLL
ncbi:Arm DNA-binding domain-containing protein [Vibrio fluvialis]|uniref:Arm DNA-binding domain-containing protein n=1 Tax=Vibrio fluvialis TaxID=676 RepID=UPI0012ADE3C4|nr:Arm DNA-binding domain-containing protein [Vibrio fluvialis]